MAEGLRTYPLGDAWDVPDTGLPPCIYCIREAPCDCNHTEGGECKCACGRCLAPDYLDLIVVLVGQLRELP